MTEVKAVIFRYFFVTNRSEKFKAKYFRGLSQEKIDGLESRYLKGLSDEQAAVAMHKDGPLLVIAGPGSGKTETMVRRTAVLVDHHLVDPSSILLTTFTEKAATSLKQRVKVWVPDPNRIEKLTIGTIHSICLGLLEEFGVQKGVYTKSLRVLDEHRASLFLFNNFEALGLKEFYEDPNGTAIKSMLALYSVFQEKGTDVKKLKASLKEDNTDLLAAIATFPNYLALLKEKQALDFSGILSRAYDLIQDKEILGAIRARYQYFMIDEYQDTNPLQDSILRTVAGPKNNISVIGDDDQSIYRFRNATVTNFLEFASRVPGCETVSLEENRRSTQQILDVSRLIVERIPQKGRMEKKLFTKREAGAPVTITRYQTDEDEAAGIAETIETLLQTKKIESYGNVAILCYSLSSIFARLKNEFDARGIPFVTRGDKSFLAQGVVQQLIELMTFATAKRKILSLEALRPPLFQFLSDKSKSEMERLKISDDVTEIERESDIPINSPYDRRRVFGFIALRREILRSNYKKGFSDLLDLYFKILTIADTFKFISTGNGEDSEEVLNQLGKFSQIVTDYSNETGNKRFSDLKYFLTYIIRAAIDNPRDDEDGEDAVVLQTIHQSKGLEYPVVFMPGLVDSRFPGRRDDSDQEVPFVPGVHKFWTTKNDFENVDSDFRRLLYVGATRAESLLYLSFFQKIKNAAQPSRYVQELIDSKKVDVVEASPQPKNKLIIKARPKDDKLRISSSHLQYYLFCPTRYKFAIKHGMAAPHRGYFAYGSSLHSAIEEVTNVARTQGLDKVDPKEIFLRHWTNFGFESLGAAERQKENASRAFLEFFAKQKPLIKNITVSEKKFTLEESNFILTGKIDAISEPKEDNLVVIDFKTGKKDKFEKEPESTFVEHQANIYSEAVSRVLEKEPSTFQLHFLGESQDKPSEFQKTITVTPGSRKKILNILAETVDRIDGRDFSPIEESERVKRCGLCEFRAICPFTIRQKAA